MTSPIQFHVFLSAVSSEFRQERVQLEIWLERKGLHVSSQEKFNQGGSTLWQKLHDEVSRCQAVICVLGAEPGWPSSGELPDGATERSWTQWESWLAWGEAPWSPPRRDQVFVFFPVDLEQRMEKSHTAASGDSNRLLTLDIQQAHIGRVKQTNTHYSPFADADDLIKQCLVLDPPTIPRTKPSSLTYATLGHLFKGRDEKLEELYHRLTAHAGHAGSHRRQTGPSWARWCGENAVRRRVCPPLCGGIPGMAVRSRGQARSSGAEPRHALRAAHSGCAGAGCEGRGGPSSRSGSVAPGPSGLVAHSGNVDTSEGAEAVEELVGNLKGGTVLITSRLADWSSEIPTLELDKLAESSAVEFLLERAKDRRRCLPTDENGAQALSLEQAGAFIAQKRSSLVDYLAHWRQRDQAVREWHDERLTKYPRAVVTTWGTTVDQLSPEGLTLLRQLGWLAPEPIPRSILPDGPAQDALVELASFSLAKFEEGGGLRRER